MSLFRPVGIGGIGLQRPLHPGDLLSGGEIIGAGILATSGAGTLTGALIASGFITRTNASGAGYIDTTDTADAILAAMNAYGAEPGTTFKFTFANTVAYLMTLAAGRGVLLDTTNGSGVVNGTASLVRDYLCTILNATPEVVLPMSMLTTTKVAKFILPPGAVSLPLIGSNGAAGVCSVIPGMYMTGTGFTTGTRVEGITQGQGGATGITTDTNSTGTQINTSVTFSPCISIASLGAKAL